MASLPAKDLEKEHIVPIAGNCDDENIEASIGVISELHRDDAGFQRSLTRRQIMMMSFGAGIGTGLWVGTGSALAKAGPAGIAVTYTMMAGIVYLMFISIGEMTAYKPIHGGFIRQSMEYVDPALGFANGINYWFSWVMIIPAEITAAISVLKFWPQTDVIPLAAWITIILAVIILANLWEIRLYGHIEVAMSIIKCITIIGMIMFMIVMTSGGISATGGPIEFRYWKNPGPFNNGLKGICAAFIQAAFSFGGGDYIAIIAGEAKDPRETVKATIAPLFYRMAAFFVLNIWLVGMCVPYNDSNLVNESGTLASPFVIAIERAGVMPLAHLLNALIFLTVMSCGITSVYIASRCLTGLSDLKLIHPVFTRKDKKGRPVAAMFISTLIGGGLCYLNCNSTAAVVYNWFTSMVGISGFIQYANVYLNYIRFRRGLSAQSISTSSLPFRALLGPYLQYFGLLLILLIMIAEFYLSISPFEQQGSKQAAVSYFFSSYLAAPLFIFDYFAYKIWFKTKIVRSKDMDFSAAAWFDEDDRQKAEAAASSGSETKPSLLRRATRAVIG